MEIAHLDPQFFVIIGQIFGHTFGERGHQHRLIALTPQADLLQQVIHLAFGRTHLDPGVQQAGGTDDLRHNPSFHLLDFIRARGRRHIDHLLDPGIEFLKAQGPVIEGRGQTKAVIHQGLLAGAVTIVHAIELRHPDMGLVKKEQEIIREIIDQVGRGSPRRLTGQMAAVILNAAAIAQLLNHLQIKEGALLQALQLNKAVLLLIPCQPLFQFLLDGRHGNLQPVTRGDKMAGRKDRILIETLQDHTAQGINHRDGFHRITKKLDPDGDLFLMHREDINNIAPHPEGAAMKGNIIAFIEHEDQTPLHLLHGIFLIALQQEVHVFILIGRAQTVYTGDRGHDQHITASEQGAGGGMTHHVDGVIDGGILLDKGVRGGDIGLRLIVVVIGDKILDGVLGKKLLELGKKLGGQGLVRGNDQGGPLYLLHHTGHGKGLTRSGHTQQQLAARPARKAAHQGLDGLRLIPGGRERSHEFEGVIHIQGYF